ncbi:hypothetical protein HAZT_HAZT007324 [Hyalella azteca]|uniref:E3 ubiquitin-protein ligase parkin n=1 Tax=Hyalella azteca TaxID=294128 RepID=A0A6A0H7A8_HYAAZ|nr:hypothetical protein HAZT_HAZT007324 [Hyalella azteca]
MGIQVQLAPEWTVAQLKTHLKPQLCSTQQHIKLIFAGKELPESLVLGQCDLGQNSVLHAVILVTSASAATPPTSPTVSDITRRVQDAAIEEFPPANCSEKPNLTTAGKEYASSETLTSDASGVPGSGERPHFYVFCSRPCRGVRVGKLRVRCNRCAQGAVTLHEDPTCWKDVLTPKQILCWCETPACKEAVKECYAEFYFKCSGHVTLGDDDVAVPLYMIRANLPGVVCLSCAEVASPVIVFECEASHVLCLDCFINYCLSKLSERQFTHDSEIGYTLPCPVNCFDSYIKEVHHFRLLGDDQYRRYQHWATEEAVLAAGGVLCPRPGCGHGLLPDADCVRITCVGGCGFVFCRLCLQEYHTGECWQLDHGQPLSSLPRSASTASFNVDTSRVGVGARWDVASAAAIQSLTKACPQCRTPTERSGGCMHMVCTRASCRFNWCWVCHKEWTRDCMAAHWFG